MADIENPLATWEHPRHQRFFRIRRGDVAKTIITSLFFSVSISGATMLNLSLLTSDMWAVLIRIFAYHEKVDWLYFLAFAAVVVGLIIYSWGTKEEDEAAAVAAVAADEESKSRDEEAGFGVEDQRSSNNPAALEGEHKNHVEDAQVHRRIKEPVC